MSNAAPRAVIVSRPTPTGFLEARVVRLAVVDVGNENRSGRRLPLTVSTHDLRVAIGILHNELRKESEVCPVVVALALEPKMPTVPPITECRTKCVDTRANERRHVVGVVLQPLVVARPAWPEQPVAHTLAIQLHGVDSEAGDIESG